MRATRYDIGMSPSIKGGVVDPEIDINIRNPWRITIESRNKERSKWAIYNGIGCFSKSNFDFICEPFPSSREENFIV